MGDRASRHEVQKDSEAARGITSFPVRLENSPAAQLRTMLRAMRAKRAQPVSGRTRPVRAPARHCDARAKPARAASSYTASVRARVWLCAGLVAGWLGMSAGARAQPNPPEAPPSEPPSSARKPRSSADLAPPAGSPPAEPKPAPAEPKPAPAEPKPAPAEPKPAPSDAKPPPDLTPDAPPPPPPPAAPGDFAGPGAAAGSEPAPSAPQDDFAEAELEYRKPAPREFSARIDVLNWLLLGRLNLELEMTLWKFISVELMPVFVTAQSPIALNYAGLDDPLTQHSNGLGPISGARAGVGVWLGGEPFRGYVIRLDFSNNGYVYRSSDSQGLIDRVSFSERRIAIFIGSHSRFGPFTFAGGFGLGYELHQVDRCGLSYAASGESEKIVGRSDGCKGKQLIALDRSLDERADLNGPLHPVYFEARFSLGVVF